VYRAAFAALPQARLTRIEDSRHFVMLDRPEEFAAALEAFLAAGR
jgi:pimeloyl-ACP methyl ester carboxylesterase